MLVWFSVIHTVHSHHTCIRTCTGFYLLQTMLPALSMGIRDSVPSSYMSPLHNKIRDAYDNGDLKTAQQIQVYTCILHNIPHSGNITVHKKTITRDD